VRLDALQRRLHSQSPAIQLAQSEAALRTWQLRLYRSAQTVLQSHHSRWQLASHSLHTVSPLATLERGFAVVRHAGKVITTVDDVSSGDTLTTHLVDGEIASQVLSTRTEKLIPADEESTS
jgi:exodeoxyribonuclease VII large subunit